MTLDRAGEPIGDEPDGHECRRGWLSGPLADQPRPCPICKPWAAAHPPRPATRAELAAFERRHPQPQPTRGVGR